MKLNLTPEKSNPVVDLRSLKAKMDYAFIHGKDKGEKTHFNPIDQLCNFSWKKGFLYCITGNPGSGKSEFINHLLILKSLRDGWKWNIYSPESYPVEDYVDTLIHGFIGKSTDPDYANQMSKAEYDRGFDFVCDHFTLFDFPEMPSPEDIQEAIKESEGKDGIVVDPFNSLDTSGQDNISEGLKMSLTRLKSVALKHKICTVLVEHPKTGVVQINDEGMPTEPTEYDLYGGKMWHNKCDIIGVVHRPYIREKTNTQVTFRTVKIKNQKLNGFPDVCGFHFNRMTNRYEWSEDYDGGRMVDAFTKLTRIYD